MRDSLQSLQTGLPSIVATWVGSFYIGFRPYLPLCDIEELHPALLLGRQPCRYKHIYRISYQPIKDDRVVVRAGNEPASQPGWAVSFGLDEQT